MEKNKLLCQKWEIKQNFNLKPKKKILCFFLFSK